MPIKLTWNLLLAAKTRNGFHILCHNGKAMLREWTKGKRKGLPFGIQLTWRGPTSRTSNCCFPCFFFWSIQRGLAKRKKEKRVSLSNRTYSAHSHELPIPVFKGFLLLVDTMSKIMLMEAKKYF